MEGKKEAPPQETPEELKKKAAREYYHANKEKLQASKKASQVKKKGKQCEEQKLPDFLADHITFRSDGKIDLYFKDRNELCAFLVYAKFKSDYAKDLYEGANHEGF
jgi:hypothetical protein